MSKNLGEDDKEHFASNKTREKCFSRVVISLRHQFIDNILSGISLYSLPEAFLNMYPATKDCEV